MNRDRFASAFLEFDSIITSKATEPNILAKNFLYPFDDWHGFKNKTTAHTHTFDLGKLIILRCLSFQFFSFFHGRFSLY